MNNLTLTCLYIVGANILSLLAEIGSGWIYLFLMDYELFLPDDTPVRIEIQVISIDGFEITLALDGSIGTYVSKVDMYCEPWKLLEALKIRLKETEQRNYQLSMKLLNSHSHLHRGTLPKSIIGKGTRNYEQELALKTVYKQDLTFIWGPPGTGKTETLANIAVNFLRMA